MQKEAAQPVRLALTQIRPISQCTFAYLRELVSKARIETLRSQGSTEVQSYVDAFDAEISAKNERLQELTREVQRLRAELRRYDEGSSEAGSGVLVRGKEREFYPGEDRGLTSA
jgi:flagellar biosynthesis chaperone FliJ